MIKCQNCSTENSPLTIKCRECGSFIQERVPNINLFDTIWELLEKPFLTFKKLCLSEQKNYVFLLFAIFGIGFTFSSFWYLGIGNVFNNLLYIIFIILAGGPFVGVLISLIFIFILFFLSKLFFKSEGNLRNYFVVTSYSLIPINITVIFFIPVELIIFGINVFMNNPSVAVLKPAQFYILFSLDGLFIIYSIVLFFIGVKVACNIKFLKAFFLSLSVLLTFFAFLFLMFFVVKKII